MQALITFLLSICNTLLRGLVIKLFWGWFILTQFPNLPRLTLMASIGLSFFVCVISTPKSFTMMEIDQFKFPKKYDIEETAKSGNAFNQEVQILFGLITLFTGFILHLIMG